jgi:hypothetical protein
MDLQIEAVNDLLRGPDIDSDDEVGTQSSTLAGADSDNDEHGNGERSLVIDGTEYVEAKSVARKSRKGKRSSVWKLGIELKRVEDGAKFWQCLICKRVQKKSII